MGNKNCFPLLVASLLEVSFAAPGGSLLGGCFPVAGVMAPWKLKHLSRLYGNAYTL